MHAAFNEHTTPTAPLRILHLEDSELDHQLVCRALKKDGLQFDIVRVDTLDAFDALCAAQHFDVILADYRLPGFTALDAWERLRQQADRPPFVLLSGAIGEAAAVAAIQTGISDFLAKDEVRHLRRVLERAIEVLHAKRAEARAVQDLAASERRLAQFAEHLQATIENERAAIAREIHDDIGGSLAAVKLDLSWVERHTDDPASQEHLKAAVDMLQHAIGASQRIMMNLRPAILDQGLYPAIQWLAESFQRRTGVKTSLSTHHQSIQADKAVQLTAYRTAQEALTNVSKYARASQVQLDLSDAEGVLTLEISDNGCGIPPETLKSPTGFGIRGLRERAKVVGGWLDISSRIGQGTTIILSIPLGGETVSSLEADFQ